MCIKSYRLRRIIADIFALVVYGFISGMIIEVLLSGMTLRQSLSSRLFAIPVNIIIAWPFGLYRDAVLSFIQKHSKKRFLSRNIADLLAYITFQLPVYGFILFLIKVDMHSLLKVIANSTLASMVLGVIYGYFLDYCRRLFRVHQSYILKSTSTCK